MAGEQETGSLIDDEESQIRKHQEKASVMLGLNMFKSIDLHQAPTLLIEEVYNRPHRQLGIGKRTTKIRAFVNNCTMCIPNKQLNKEKQQIPDTPSSFEIISTGIISNSADTGGVDMEEDITGNTDVAVVDVLMVVVIIVIKGEDGEVTADGGIAVAVVAAGFNVVFADINILLTVSTFPLDFAQF
ncbi:hypothetical protein GQX74_014667 [Glossina fuscipes]|nr:hypothetical protein GQX74_014667 [Glossina fuscipes]